MLTTTGCDPVPTRRLAHARAQSSAIAAPDAARAIASASFCLSMALPVIAWAQTDPGPRPGAAGAGGPFPGLSASEIAFFNAARGVFEEIDSVSGGVAGEEGIGLGPTFNANSCAACHAQPDVGGTSPHPRLGQVLRPNPQVAMATLDRVP